MGLRHVGLVVMLLIARVVWGQIDAHAIERDLKGKSMPLRSYSAEPVSKYLWVDDKLVVAPSHSFTLGVFTTRSVKLKGGALIFEGVRGTLVRDPDKNALAAKVELPMKLEIDLNNAPPTLTLPMLEEMLFFPNAADAVAGFPTAIADILPADANSMPKTRCDCERVFDREQWVKLAKKDPKFVAPKLISTAEPEFSEEAREKKISGAIAVVIYINTSGRVEDVWIGRPLGFGLDENAVKAVRQYVFKPATYEGRAVGTDLTVEVNYQIFAR